MTASERSVSQPMTPIPGRFAGKLVLVTGAGSGIGAATAKRFAAEGAHVFVTDLEGDAADRVAAEIRNTGAYAEAGVLDQSDERSVSAFAATQAQTGLDIACINAGAVLPLQDLADTTAAQWDWIHGVNLRGAYLIARAVTPLMRARGGGAIVFTASIASFRGHGGSAAYATTKAGLAGLSRSLAMEVAQWGIRVNTVCPGAIASRMGGTVEELQRFLPLYPLGRIGQPEDVAAAICFLASHDARHITAADLVVDGGASAEIPLPEEMRAGSRTARTREAADRAG